MSTGYVKQKRKEDEESLPLLVLLFLSFNVLSWVGGSTWQTNNVVSSGQFTSGASCKENVKLYTHKCECCKLSCETSFSLACFFLIKTRPGGARCTGRMSEMRKMRLSIDALSSQTKTPGFAFCVNLIRWILIRSAPTLMSSTNPIHIQITFPRINFFNCHVVSCFLFFSFQATRRQFRRSLHLPFCWAARPRSHEIFMNASRAVPPTPSRTFPPEKKHHLNIQLSNNIVGFARLRRKPLETATKWKYITAETMSLSLFCFFIWRCSKVQKQQLRKPGRGWLCTKDDSEGVYHIAPSR